MDVQNQSVPLNIIIDHDMSSTTQPLMELPPVNVLYTFSEVLVAILAVIGNAMTIYVFAVDRKLRRVTNYYIASLALADLLVGILGVPFAILTSLGLPRNLWACIPMLSFLIVLCTISIFCLVAVSMDRYWAILYPLMYSRIMTGSIARRIILCCWLAGTFIGLLPLWWHEKDGLCLFTHIMHYNYLVFLYFFTIIFPGLLMAFFYAHIYTVVIKQLRQIESQTMTNDSDSIQSGKKDPFLMRRTTSEPNSFKIKINTIRDSFREIRRNSSATKMKFDRRLGEPLRKKNRAPSLGSPRMDPSRKDSGTSLVLSQLSRPSRREVKAAKNLSIIVLFFLLCWLPLYTINCVQAFCSECPVPEQLLNFTIILSHANSAVNPLLYAYHMKDFRLALQMHILERLGSCGKKTNGSPTPIPAHHSAFFQTNLTPNSTYTRSPPQYHRSISYDSEMIKPTYLPLSQSSGVWTHSNTIQEDFSNHQLQNITTDNSMLTLDPGIVEERESPEKYYLPSDDTREIFIPDDVPSQSYHALDSISEPPSPTVTKKGDPDLQHTLSSSVYSKHYMNSSPQLNGISCVNFSSLNGSFSDISSIKHRALSCDDVINSVW